jgi:hypothetical protein
MQLDQCQNLWIKFELLVINLSEHWKYPKMEYLHMELESLTMQ